MKLVNLKVERALKKI